MLITKIRVLGIQKMTQFIFIAMFVFLSAGVSEASAEVIDSPDSIAIKYSNGPLTIENNRFPIIPPYIKNLSYDVKKTDEEIYLLNQIEVLSGEFASKLSEPELSVFMESELLWADYYEKETYGLHPANAFIYLTISGDIVISGDKIVSWDKIISEDKKNSWFTIINEYEKISGNTKKINFYRENLKAIIEGRKLFIDNLLKNRHQFYDDEYDETLRLINENQKLVEYFAGEKHRPKIAEGEIAWRTYFNANYHFLKAFFAESPDKIDMHIMFVLKERLRILEFQVIALQILRIEREER